MKLHNSSNGVLGGIVGAFIIGISAQATVNMLHLEESFQSGATFSGNLTFNSGWDNLTAVKGKLSGGSYTDQDITWIWDPKSNFAAETSPNNGGNFLMSGNIVDSYQDLVVITWNYSTDPITLTGNSGGGIDGAGSLNGYAALGIAGYGNSIDYTDLSTSATLTAVPEPTTIIAGALLLIPFGASAIRGMRKKQNV